jgi:CRP/FNR family transcriptional regulator
MNISNDTADLLRHGAFGNRLEPATLKRLDALARVREFRRSATIMAPGDVLPFVGHVQSGILRVEKLLSGGRQQIVGLLAPCDMFGHIHAARSGLAIEAVTDVALRCYDRPAFESLVDVSPDLAHAVLLSVLDELATAREWAVLLSGTTVAARFACYLLIQLRRSRLPPAVARMHGRPTVALPIGRSDLAHCLGTTVESISRTVQRFTRSGLIRSDTPLQFEILDLSGLIAAADCDGRDCPVIPAELQNNRGEPELEECLPAA